MQENFHLNSMAFGDEFDSNEPDLRGEALGLYSHMSTSGKLHRTLNFLQHKSRKLKDFESSKSPTCRQNRHYAGQQSIAIDQVKGTEGRQGDFDDAFNPLHDRLRSRWLGGGCGQVVRERAAAGRSDPHGWGLLRTGWAPPYIGCQGLGRGIRRCGSD